MRNLHRYSKPALGLALGVAFATPAALAQPLVTEDGATHVAYLGDPQTVTGTIWFRVDAQNRGVSWSVNTNLADVTSVAITCPEGTREVGRDYTDPEVRLPQFNLAEPTVIDTPIDGQVNDVDVEFLDQLIAGSCYASIESGAGVRYNGQIVAAQ